LFHAVPGQPPSKQVDQGNKIHQIKLNLGPFCVTRSRLSAPYDDRASARLVETRASGAGRLEAVNRTVVSVACRGSSAHGCAIKHRAMAWASGPLKRTTPIPPRPGGVAMATMVSEVENTVVDSRWSTVDSRWQSSAASPVAAPGCSPSTDDRSSTEDRRLWTDDYFLAEINTVLLNASPMLSVVAPGISATAMCTSRRSYGFSGPSC